MSSRRRVNKSGRNRRGPRTGGIDLNDLDGALKSAVLGGDGGSENNSNSSSPLAQQENVNVTIDSAEERRFVMHESSSGRGGSGGIFSNHNNDTSTNFDDGNFANNHTSNFATHQENFSATKYIKP
jgi:hypothetical protein